ncbi:glycine betaine uptake BCCT transporter [Maledivibacter halophilus]|uniref:Glycine betaine transporter n=1 Tax=Maledivibacter halophilus TaxID=36842 RepID=A0A1T5IKL9_9FIRM|nr:BCCT family transporter [Maledivibacter halophilus]SKC39650.1 glycine betaine transporter [Maledivibacter halophilus]
MSKFWGKIDKFVFWLSAIICIIFVAWSILSPEGMKNTFSLLFDFYISNFGWAYLLAEALFVGVAIAIAFSKYGKIRLSKDNEKPDFSTGSWFAMLFSGAMGIGLVFWSVSEPIMHFADPAFGTASTAESARLAMNYTFFHWGFHPWASYAAVALPLAYFQFRKGMPGLISSIFYPLIGEKVKGPIGKAIDTFVVTLTLFGVASSFGLGAMQVNTGLNLVYGIPNTVATAIIIIIICTFLFTLSTAVGIEKGMKRLSNTNMLLAFFLMVFVLFIGPTKYIVKVFVEGVGDYLQNIVWMSFFTDAQGTVAKHSGYDWVGTWTVFYWAWWLTWAPFVGSFIARISKGRTVKEFLLGIFVFPSLLSFVWFSIMGGSALHIELFGAGGITQATLNELTSAIFVTFNHFPLSQLLSLLAMVVVLIFFLTSADCATLVVSMMTSGGDLEPFYGLKIFWGIIVGALASMFVIAGGLQAVQTLSFALSFPFVIIMVLMLISLFKAFKQEKISLHHVNPIVKNEKEETLVFDK